MEKNQTKDIRILLVTFDLELKHTEIGQFRGAVLKTTGPQNNLFHNHTTKGNIYRYPLIQYKRLNEKAALLCIEKGIEGVQDFFSATDWKLEIGNEIKEIKVEQLKVHPHRVGVWEQYLNFRINNWLPLNQANYKKYHTLTGLSDKVQLLEHILTGHILSFLEGIDLIVKKQIEVKIQNIHSERIMRYKNQEMQAFTLSFSSNVSLPNFIGLGKGSSVGFGVVEEIAN